MKDSDASKFNRRDAIKQMGVGAIVACLGIRGLGGNLNAAENAPSEASSKLPLITPPPLPYTFNALEPYIDARTMEIHYTKHHQAYINNVNTVLQKYPELFEDGLETLISNLDRAPEEVRISLRNNLGGHLNHVLFWDNLTPNKEETKPQGLLLELINQKFGSFEECKKQMQAAAMGVFGSGWAWLSLMNEGGLAIRASSNQDSLLMTDDMPLLGLDVWEHAYYLNYQNRRVDYVNAFWNVANWKVAGDRYELVMSS